MNRLKTVCKKYLTKNKILVPHLGEAKPITSENINDLIELLFDELKRINKIIFLAILLFGIVGGVYYYLNSPKIMGGATFLFLILGGYLWYLGTDKSKIEKLLTLAQDLPPNQITLIIWVIYNGLPKDSLKNILSVLPKTRKLLTRKKLAEKQELSYEYHFLQTGLQHNEAILLLTEEGMIRGITQDNSFEIENNLSQLIKLTRQHANWLETFVGMRVTIRIKETIQPIKKITIQDIKEKMEKEFWAPFSKKLSNKIKHLHIVTYGELNLLPYELGAPDGLTFNNYPDLISYYKLHHGMTNVKKMLKAGRSRVSKIFHHDLSTPCGAAPLGINVYDAANHPSEMHIPLVNAEAGMVNHIWQPAVYQPVDVKRGEPIVAFLHLSGHGLDKGTGFGTVYMLLGKDKDKDKLLSVEEILKSPLHPRVVFLSACMIGKTFEKSDGEYSELISAFFRRGGEYVVAPTVPIPDFYMPLLVILFHQAWQRGHHPERALAIAKYRFRTGKWYKGTESIVRDCYHPVLEKHFADIAKAGNIRRWKMIQENWPVPMPYRQPNNMAIINFLKLLQDGKNREDVVDRLLDNLCSNKAHLDAENENFSTWVKGFGYIGK